MGRTNSLSTNFNQLLREIIGTYLLVLTGTSALTSITITSQQISTSLILINVLSFSLTLGLLTYHLSQQTLFQGNPITTTLLWFNQRLSTIQLIINIIGQSFAAILASISVGLLYGNPGVRAGLGAPIALTNMGPAAVFVAEALSATIFLIVLQYHLRRGTKSNYKLSLQLTIAFAIAIMLSSGISGGAINPVRAIAPQLAAGQADFWWIYLFAPLLPALGIGLIVRANALKPSLPAQQPAPQTTPNQHQPAQNAPKTAANITVTPATQPDNDSSQPTPPQEPPQPANPQPSQVKIKPTATVHFTELGLPEVAPASSSTPTNTSQPQSDHSTHTPKIVDPNPQLKTIHKDTSQTPSKVTFIDYDGSDDPQA